MAHFHPKISAIKGIIADIDKAMQDDSIMLEKVHQMCQMALGSINSISEYKGDSNGNKTSTKARVRKQSRTPRRLKK